MLLSPLRRARHSAPLQLLLGLAAALVVPTALLTVAGSYEPSVTNVALYVLSIAFLATCTLMLVEANLAVRRRLRPVPPPPPAELQPDVTVMVVAYLPNEADVIKDTLANLLDEVDLPGRAPQVLLAYNTPVTLPVESELRAWAAREPRLDVLRVEDSTSKAENVMAALASVRGEIVGILDADHQLRPDAAQLASRWINAGYDVVQGRCVVRNARENLLTRIIAFEFETIYGVAHAGRSLLLDTGIFGGANGWWRTSTLRTIGLDHRMLTEDIDSSLRALLAGYRIVHERDVVSTELAPTTLRAWWKQRTRWSQGWFQVTLRHGAAIRRTKALRGPARLYWTALLSWREAFPIVSVQLFSVLAASVLLGQSIRPKTDPFLLWTTAITLMSGLIIGAGAWRVRSRELAAQFGPGALLLALLTTWPYTLLKNAVAIAAMVRELLGDRRWMVTSRTAQPTTQPTLQGSLDPIPNA